MAAAPQPAVTPAWLLESLRGRSFGILLLLVALIGLVPGVSTLSGVLLLIPATQMILGKSHPSLPRFVALRPLPTNKIAVLVTRLRPVLLRLERIVRPRWPTPFMVTRRLIGVVVLLLSATLLSPLPFSHIVPIFAIMLVSFAYLEEDGVLLMLGIIASLASVLITAATVWASFIVGTAMAAQLRVWV
jgi:hypothetical protein